MKKFFAIILVTLVLAASLGVSVFADASEGSVLQTDKELDSSTASGDSDSISSVFGEGSLLSIISLALSAVAIGVIVAARKKREAADREAREQDKEEQDEEEQG